MAYDSICPHLHPSTIDVKVPVVGGPSEASDPRVLRAGSDLVHRMKFLNDGSKLVVETEL